MADDGESAHNAPSSHRAQHDSRARTPEAQRALEEAHARRTARDRHARSVAREINGRAGPDPVRYGDWENKGIASDF